MAAEGLTKVAAGHDHCLHLGRAAVWLTNNGPGHSHGNWPARRPFMPGPNRAESSGIESSRVVSCRRLAIATGHAQFLGVLAFARLGGNSI